MALRATMSKPVAKATAPAGLKAAVQRVAAVAGVSVASLAVTLAAHADVSGRPRGATGGRSASISHARCPAASALSHPLPPPTARSAGHRQARR